eukprot:gene27816-34595_t
MSHSCQPNCTKFSGLDIGVIRAIRPIAIGEELTLSYNGLRDRQFACVRKEAYLHYQAAMFELEPQLVDLGKECEDLAKNLDASPTNKTLSVAAKALLGRLSSMNIPRFHTHAMLIIHYQCSLYWFLRDFPKVLDYSLAMGAAAMRWADTLSADKPLAETLYHAAEVTSHDCLDDRDGLKSRKEVMLVMRDEMHETEVPKVTVCMFCGETPERAAIKLVLCGGCKQ